MRLCQKCLENNWQFEYIDGYIIATCKMCGHEVEFEAKKKVYKPKPKSWFAPAKPRKTKKGDSLFIQNGEVLNSTQLKVGIKIEEKYK